MDQEDRKKDRAARNRLRVLRQMLTDNEETNRPIYAEISQIKRDMEPIWRFRWMQHHEKRIQARTM